MKTLSSSKYFKDLVLLFFLTLIVYWPLSLNYLSLKNDALVYFAYRYHFSEAIRHGYLPFWSPYFYTGFPIHADIQGGVWNPLVLLLSLISKYDMVLLQWEVVIYLFVSAVGMYRLIKYFGLSRIAAICSAVSFMSCGYMTDSISIIPWISSAAFVPFILLYFLRLMKSPISLGAVKFSIALSLMFLCGYPSFFIYLNYIIAISFLIWAIQHISNNNKNAALKAFFSLGIAYLLFLLICSPAIISYYEFLPYYSRGVGISYQRAVENPFVPFSFISYLLPNIVSKATFLPTDLSMRNTYIGLFIFIFFLAGLKKMNWFKIIIFVFTVFSFLFSLGDITPVRKFCFYNLPLMDTFRHPGTIRAFTSIGMILLAAYPLNAFFSLVRNSKLKWLCYFFLAALLVTCINFVATIPSLNNHINFSWSRATLKQFLQGMSFQKFSMIICILQIIFIVFFLTLQQPKQFSQKTLAALIILNSILFAWIGLPFTVVSQYKTIEVNNFIQSFPNGYPVPNTNTSIGAEVYSDSIQISPHGYPNFYNKRITIQDHIITPTINKDYDEFLANKSLRLQLKNHPFIYVSTDSVSIQPAEIQVLRFATNSFSFNVNSSVTGNLQLFQQYNPNWHVSVNHRPVQIKKTNIAFMSVKIPAGVSLIEWKYSPKKVYIGMTISALSLLAIVFYLVFKKKQERIYE